MDAALIVPHAKASAVDATVRSARAGGLRVVALALCSCGDRVVEADEGAQVLRPADLGLTASMVGRAASLHDCAGLQRWLLARLAAHLVEQGLDVLTLRAGVEVQPAFDVEVARSSPLAFLDPELAVLPAATAGPVVRAWCDATDDWTLEPTDSRTVPPVVLLAPTTWKTSSRLSIDGGLRLDGDPVWLLDLSTCDPRRPWLWDAECDPPRVLLSEHQVLAEVVTERLAAWAPEDGRDLDHEAPYAVTSTGTPVGPALREAYRRENASAATVPDPFDPDGARELTQWLLVPTTDESGGRVSRYLAAVRATRPDLQLAFPGPDLAPLVAWARKHGQDDPSYDASLLVRSTTGAPPRSRTAPARARLRRLVDAARSRPFARPPGPAEVVRTPGVNLVGYLTGELGIGQSARLVLQALRAADVPVATETVSTQLASRQAGVASHDPLEHDVTLICVNAAQTPAVDLAAGAAWVGTRRVGYWYWEVEDFPVGEHGGFDHVDEVWVATDFVRDAIARHSPVPVHTLTPPLWHQPPDGVPDRATLGLPLDRTIVLFVFDYLSTAERKNPWGAVEAFRRARDLGTDGRPLLVVKSVNGERCLADRERLRLTVADDPDILLLEDYQTGAEVAGLMAACDVYLSLHRSEGLGLTIADAMTLGKPVVATAYGGNVQFMDTSTSFLVDWHPTAVPAHCAPYPEGSRWADPDLDQAARHLRTVYDDPAGAAEVGRRAAEALRTRFSPEAAGAAMRARLDELRAER